MNEREALNRALEQRITDYLSAGGLFNPELADHVAVRDLLIDCRKAVAQPEQEPVAWPEEHLKFLNFLYGAGEFEGVWFEQKHQTEKGTFWWRKHLRRLFDAPPQRKPLPKSENSKHKYNPHKKYPWFCADCGYAEHELLMHTAAHGIKE